MLVKQIRGKVKERTGIQIIRVPIPTPCKNPVRVIPVRIKKANRILAKDQATMVINRDQEIISIGRGRKVSKNGERWFSPFYKYNLPRLTIDFCFKNQYYESNED
jgi:hypothetical protein